MQTVEAKLRARAANPDPATEAAAAARELTVSFNADCNDGMPWRFLPSQGSVKVCAPPIRLAIFQSTLCSILSSVSTHPISAVSVSRAHIQNGLQGVSQSPGFEFTKVRPTLAQSLWSQSSESQKQAAIL